MKESLIELIGYWLVLIVSAINTPKTAIAAADRKLNIPPLPPPPRDDSMYISGNEDEIPF